MVEDLGAEAQIPYIGYSDIEWEANSFLNKNYHNEPFPVDTDIICDKVGINIIYIPYLKRQFGLKAYTTSDFKTIVVDEEILNSETEYRFCVAHELGHIVLHKEYYPSNIHDIETYLRYANGYISGPAESQADIFASCLLMPSKNIYSQLTKTFGENIKIEISKQSISKITKTFSSIAEYFGVSGEHLRRRIQYVFPDLIDSLL